MRTNIVLDDELVKEALKYSGASTKKGLVHEALKEFIESHKRKDLRELKGRIHLRKGYDYKKLRQDE
ncbi:MAG: type II toxin-antitoxin system VapB family antitoxin [Deltaproteobacteria bacterium]|nr:type II toxin-antitoxin system VapB family antitoxin [Deltaproteobacteria bacterium]